MHHNCVEFYEATYVFLAMLTTIHIKMHYMLPLNKYCCTHFLFVSWSSQQIKFAPSLHYLHYIKFASKVLALFTSLCINASCIPKSFMLKAIPNHRAQPIWESTPILFSELHFLSERSYLHTTLHI